MNEGLTTDHQILTKSGWKYFEHIDITKDELYCFEYNIYDDECDPLDYFSFGNKLIHYIKPLKKNYEQNYKGKLYQIKNDKIDIKMTHNYNMPIIFEHNNDRYSNYKDVTNFEDIYKIIFKENKYKDSDSDRDKILFLTENNKDEEKNKNKDKYSHIFYYVNYIKLEDMTQINGDGKNKDNTSIFSFTLPIPQNSNKKIIHSSYRIYVRRNNKEFWV